MKISRNDCRYEASRQVITGDGYAARRARASIGQGQIGARRWVKAGAVVRNTLKLTREPAQR
jgi:hypothetical protein